MKTITTSSIIFGILVGVTLCARGQGFVNLNFEAASTKPSPLGYPLLEWSTAAPGWSHSSGGDTSYIYYGGIHTGLSQWYFLADAPGTQLEGNYSLAFASGHLSSGINTPWVNAYISQTGTVPLGTLSLRMLATGPFAVFVGGVSVPMYSLGGNSYGGDISAFTGSLYEVKIMNTATTLHTPTVVDNVLFSPVAVPEPSSIALSLLGMVLAICRRNKHAA
jgi:hypothetical protein